MPRMKKERWSCYCVGDWNFITVSWTSSSLDFEKQNHHGISLKGETKNEMSSERLRSRRECEKGECSTLKYNLRYQALSLKMIEWHPITAARDPVLAWTTHQKIIFQISVSLCMSQTMSKKLICCWKKCLFSSMKNLLWMFCLWILRKKYNLYFVSLSHFSKLVSSLRKLHQEEVKNMMKPRYIHIEFPTNTLDIFIQC